VPPLPSVEKDIQLWLSNRFKVDVPEDAEDKKLYNATKELVLPVLRQVTIEQSIRKLNLMDVLEAGIKHAAATNNRELSAQINKILENIAKLEEYGLVTKEDNYESFVHAVALEVANRAAIRENQRKEISRLNAALNKLRQGPTAADMTDAQARLTSAQANLAKAQAGPTDQDAASARQKVENAKNALWASQASRDATCGRPKGGDTDPQCQQARAQVNSAEGNVAIAQNDLDKLLAGPNQNDVISAQQQVTQAQAAIDKLRQGPTAADITQAQSSITQAEAALEAVKSGPDPIDVQVAQAGVEQAQVNLKQAQLKLQQSTLTAPFNGVITAVTLVPGQNMSASGNPVQLSDLGTLQVVTNVSELDRARLKVGQEVQMTLEALPGVNVEGIVDAISTAGVTTQGVVNFPVTIKLVNPDPAIAPGMTANLNIIIDKRDNVLLVPNRALRNNGRQRAVTVMVEGQQISVPVQTGMTDGTNTEITGGGLKEGDQIVVGETRLIVFMGARPAQGAPMQQPMQQQPMMQQPGMVQQPMMQPGMMPTAMATGMPGIVPTAAPPSNSGGGRRPHSSSNRPQQAGGAATPSAVPDRPQQPAHPAGGGGDDDDVINNPYRH